MGLHDKTEDKMLTRILYLIYIIRISNQATRDMKQEFRRDLLP
jgi:hypothetical protein